jgi:hypothetical protein
MPHHTTRVSIVDPEGNVYYCSRKLADWLLEVGRAKPLGEGRIALLFEARELRPRKSGKQGPRVLQLVAKTNRRKRGGRTSVHVRLPADRRPTPKEGE